MTKSLTLCSIGNKGFHMGKGSIFLCSQMKIYKHKKEKSVKKKPHKLIILDLFNS